MSTLKNLVTIAASLAVMVGMAWNVNPELRVQTQKTLPAAQAKVQKALMELAQSAAAISAEAQTQVNVNIPPVMIIQQTNASYTTESEAAASASGAGSAQGGAVEANANVEANSGAAAGVDLADASCLPQASGSVAAKGGSTSALGLKGLGADLTGLIAANLDAQANAPTQPCEDK